VVGARSLCRSREREPDDQHQTLTLQWFILAGELVQVAKMIQLPLAFLNRRVLLTGSAATAGSLLLPSRSASAELVPTPSQTEGPFYPVEFPSDMDNDLVRIGDQAAQALGQVTYISGRVVTARGQAVRGATIEIWQCDANGIYRHPRAGGQGRIDHAFQGYGRTQVDEQGAYVFRTIKPVPYPGRTPHIHFAVHVPGQGRLVTQMYIEGEPQNARDGLLNSIKDARARGSVIVSLAPGQNPDPGALYGRFDIVLGA
jgi:protocatechuate 3,4-dioxygenase, beta subunit